MMSSTSNAASIFFGEDDVVSRLRAKHVSAPASLQIGMVVETAEEGSSDDEDDENVISDDEDDSGQEAPSDDAFVNAGQEASKPTSDGAFAIAGSDKQQRQRNESEVTEHESSTVDSPERLRPGHVRVAWFPKGNKEIIGQDKVNILLLQYMFVPLRTQQAL